MKKCAVISLYGNVNFGNKLQNYAVSQLLKKNNIESEIIRYSHYENDKNYHRNFLKIFDSKFLLNKIKNIYEIKINKKSISERNNNFNLFNKFMNYSDFIINNKEEVKKLNEMYDYFLFGSDQIWNVGAFRFYDLAFGTYFDRNKKFSLSASFGRENIPNEYKEKYKKALNEFKMISVREDAGKKIVKDIAEREDALVLLDPTMMLDCDDWDKVAKKPVNYNGEKYILNYFLGNLSKEKKEAIELLAKQKGYKIINILDINDPFYCSGPSEFLYLEKNAELICTDSFHSAVFGILYKTPFIVFERNDSNASMNSRLETLLNKFKFEDRYYKGVLDEKYLTCDYSHCKKILEEERKKTDEFLKKVLEIE